MAVSLEQFVKQLEDCGILASETLKEFLPPMSEPKDAEELALVHKALKPGGYALIFVPALSFLYSPLDKQLGHYRRYHKPGLSALARSAGFTLKKVKYFDIAGVLPWYLAYVLLKRPMSAGPVGLYDSLIIPVTRALEAVIPPPFGKNLLLIAQKS